MGRISYLEALRRTGLIEALRPFDPHVAGTPPLGLDVPDSDVDILCRAQDADAFVAALWSGFSGEAGFAIHQCVDHPRAIVASFQAEGWVFQVYGEARPVAEQDGWRHFLIERRLLGLGGSRLRDAVMTRRVCGLKTEPAFADALELDGDPYAALLALEPQDDISLRRLIRSATTPDKAR